MDILQNGKFYNPTRGYLSPHEVVREMVAYLLERPHRCYEIVVGTDSAPSLEPTFPVAIVVLRKGEGGRFFLRKVKYPPERKFYNRHDRILTEVLLSCELALWLRDAFAAEMKSVPVHPVFTLDHIHADIGERGITRDMIREVTGLIRGHGFTPMIKPDSFAASSVADRFT